MKKSKILKVMSTCLLAVAILVATALIFTPKAQAATSGYYTYTVSDGKATITDCNTSISGDITIPSTLGGYPVTSIGNWAFSDCTSLGSVTIPDSVTSIGVRAFSGCSSLTSVTIPDGVTSIDISAFYECTSLTSVTIPDSVTSIGNYAFYRCTSLTSVTIPDSVTSIDISAFSDCTSLESVTIGDSVTSIGDSAFRECTNLTSVTIPDSVTSIGEGAFSGCSSLTSVTIGNSVTSIGNSAFYNCYRLTSVTIPDRVTSIGNSAFFNCNRLTGVTIGNSVTSIGDYAFSNCTSLTDVYYAGNRTQWNSISVGSGNGFLTNATVYYNHTHDYTLIPELRVEPTCAEAGYIEYTCAYGETYRVAIPVLDHDYSGPVVTVEPTCKTEGYIGNTCTRCDAVEVITVLEIRHQWNQEPGYIAPTCVTWGFSYYGCPLCGTKKDFTELNPLGHDYSGTATVIEPTCTEQGYTKIQCIRCDDYIISDYTDEVGHKMVLVPASDPTCTEPGLSAGTACQYCGMVGVAQKETAPALGGNCDYTADPTTCSNCGYVRADVVITNVVLRPSCSGLYFKGGFTFGAHETVSRYGIAVSLYNDLPVADDSDATSLYTVGENSVLISNILGEGKNGRDLIYARPYVLLEDGTYIYGDVVVTNLKSVVETIDAKFDGLTTTQKTAIADMYLQHTAAMQNWLIPKIKEFGEA